MPEQPQDWAITAKMYHEVGTGTSSDGWKCMVAWNCDCYYDTAQTTNIQTVTVRSVPVPTGAIYAFEIYATIMNDVPDKGGVIQGTATVGRGVGNVFRPTALQMTNVKNLGNSSLDLVANTSTQSADVQVQGTTSGAGIINWHVWTTVKRSV